MSSPREKIVNIDYIIHSTIVDPKHDPSVLNGIDFVNPEVESLYANFPRGITLGYHLCLGLLRYHWKGLIEEHNSKGARHNTFGYGIP